MTIQITAITAIEQKASETARQYRNDYFKGIEKNPYCPYVNRESYRVWKHEYRMAFNRMESEERAAA